MKKTFDIIQKIIFIMTNLIIIFLLGILIYHTFQVNIKKVKSEEVFNYTLFIVNSGSMKNEISINDIIVVKRTKEVEKNDIIAFEQQGQLIVHRIVEKKQDEIITKGDANNQTDEPIKYNQIIGKVVKIIPLIFIMKMIIIIVVFNIIIGIIKKYIDKKYILREGERKNEE